LAKKEKQKKKIKAASIVRFSQQELEQLLINRKAVITVVVDESMFFLFYSPTTAQKWVLCYYRDVFNPLKERTEERHSLWIQPTFEDAFRFACYFAVLHHFDPQQFFVHSLKHDKQMLSILADLLTETHLWSNQPLLAFNQDIFEQCVLFEEENDRILLNPILVHEYVPAYNLSHHGSEELIRNYAWCIYAADRDDMDVSYLIFYHLDRFVLLQQSKHTGHIRCSEHGCILPLQKMLLMYVDEPRSMLCMKINVQHQHRIDAFKRFFEQEQHL